MLGDAGCKKPSIRKNFLVSQRELNRACYNAGSQKLAKAQPGNTKPSTRTVLLGKELVIKPLFSFSA